VKAALEYLFGVLLMSIVPLLVLVYIWTH